MFPQGLDLFIEFRAFLSAFLVVDDSWLFGHICRQDPTLVVGE